MTSQNQNRNEIQSLKEKVESTILAEKSINEHDQPYYSENFKSWILEPVTNEIIDRISDLHYDEMLLKRIDSWIDDLKYFLNEEIFSLISCQEIHSPQLLRSYMS